MITPVVDDMAIIKYLDVLEYVKGSRAAKTPDDLAEYQGRKIESAIESAVQYVKNDHKELTTKGDLLATENSLRAELKGDIKDLRYDTLKFIVWTGVSVVMSILVPLIGIFGRVFHWF